MRHIKAAAPHFNDISERLALQSDTRVSSRTKAFARLSTGGVAASVTCIPNEVNSFSQLPDEWNTPVERRGSFLNFHLHSYLYITEYIGCFHTKLAAGG